MIDPTPSADDILQEATREAAHLVSLFAGEVKDRAALFDAMDQHARTLWLASVRAEIPSVAQDMSRMWGENLLQRQLLRLTYLLADRRVPTVGIDQYPETCRSNGRLNLSAVMAHAFSVLIDALEKPGADHEAQA